ncbi:MAG: hypothetical protein V4568_18325 [Pseudomonadota bacterium]
MKDFAASLDLLFKENPFFFTSKLQQKVYKSKVKNLRNEYADASNIHQIEKKILAEVKQLLEKGDYSPPKFSESRQSLDYLLKPEKEEDVLGVKHVRLDNLLVQSDVWNDFETAYRYLAKDKTADTAHNEQRVRNQLAALRNGKKETCVVSEKGLSTEFCPSSMFPDGRQRILWDRTVTAVDKNNPSSTRNPAEALFHEGVHAIEALNNEVIQKLRQITPHPKYQTHEEWAASLIQNRILKAKGKPEREGHTSWQLSATSVIADRCALLVTTSDSPATPVEQHEAQGWIRKDGSGEILLTDKTGSKNKYDVHQLSAVIDISIQIPEKESYDILDDALRHNDIIKISLSPGQLPKYKNAAQQLRLAQFPSTTFLPKNESFIARNLPGVSALASWAVGSRAMEGKILERGDPGETITGEVISGSRIKGADPNDVYLMQEPPSTEQQFYKIDLFVLSSNSIGKKVTLTYPQTLAVEQDVSAAKKTVDTLLTDFMKEGYSLEKCQTIVEQQISQQPPGTIRDAMQAYLLKAIKYAGNAKLAVDEILNKLISDKKPLEKCPTLIEEQIAKRVHTQTSDLMRAYIPEAMKLAEYAKAKGFTHGYKHVVNLPSDNVKGDGLNATQIAVAIDGASHNHAKIYTLKPEQTIGGLMPQFGKPIEGKLIGPASNNQDKTQNFAIDQSRSDGKKNKR